MLYTYPSNRLENLVSALDTLLNELPRAPLQPDTILVQHPGMQHWLSMELAQRSQNQLCMNAEYPLPVRYFWDLIRLILGPEAVPDRSVYSREILAWRIYVTLADEAIANHPLMSEPTHYWKDQPDRLTAQRRFQLSEQLADLFEQYLMFRPEWIEQWETNEADHWQALIWKALVKQNPNHPLRLMRLAAEKLHEPVQALPAHFFVFGINTLAPLWLDFLSSLAEKTPTDIHLLYLNPSDEHWDSLMSEKRQLKTLANNRAKHRATWLSENEDEFWTVQASNPLLTSLGVQGQAFVKLLSERAHYEAEVFSSPQARGLLGHLQADLLKARDGRKTPEGLPEADTLCITSAHSAFREVQGLHDWLLHQFNNDPTLTPKDVVVMCPNVEDYAPFVHAVFSRSFAEIADDIPPLPCSIADRNLRDSDPTVAAFLELLTLPDARFEVNQIISWLRVPAISDKFSLTSADIQTLSHWLSEANVHWGLNATHKGQWLEANATSHFTWEQGLDRLLLGFAYSDEDCFINDHALLNHVEGFDAVLLGKMTEIVEQLQSVRSELSKERTPSQWQSYLIEQLQIALISSDQAYERSNQSILNAINDFTEFANRANLDDELISLNVVRHLFENAFASPEQTGSQFMTGQITACSMVPMRSIPFKIVAILGLNDGQFPRNRPPMGFDLMANDKPRLGDRSRRGDDRYLFLEALLSARDALYLSYQGFDINKNEPKPPSLVLEELFDYLKQAYGFNPSSDVRVMPLQPFSPKNYLGEYPTFEDRWSHLAATKTSTFTRLKALADLKTDWHIKEWVQFFTHPSKYFAQQRLGLYLESYDQIELEDSEPFALSHLDRYQIQAQTIEEALSETTSMASLDYQLASSAFPLSNLVPSQIESWQVQAREFAQTLAQQGANSIELQHQTLDFQSFNLTADLPQASEGLLTWRLANPKGKDIIQLWLLHLFANVKTPTHSRGFFRGKDDRIEIFNITPVEHARNELESLHRSLTQGVNEPMFLHADLLLPMLRDQWDEKRYGQLWADPYHTRGFSYDPYVAYFWLEAPSFVDTQESLEQTYSTLFAHASLAEFEEE